jgi:hypothetical protein
MFTKANWDGETFGESERSKIKFLFKSQTTIKCTQKVDLEIQYIPEANISWQNWGVLVKIQLRNCLYVDLPFLQCT